MELQDEEKYFTAKDMLSSWHKLKDIPENRLVKNFGIAMQYWLDIPQDKFDLINKSMNIIEFKKEFALEISWISGSDNRKNINKPEYNISEAINEYYYLNVQLSRLEVDEHQREGCDIMKMRDELLCNAQGMIAYWNTTLKCPTMDEYVYHMRNYSFYWTYMQIMKLFSQTKDDFSQLAHILAILNIIYKDYETLNLEIDDGDNARIGDYTKKLFTVPVIHAITFSEHEDKIMNVDILRENNCSEGMKQYFACLLDSKNSRGYAEENIKYLKEQALLEVKRLGGNPLMEDYIRSNF